MNKTKVRQSQSDVASVVMMTLINAPITRVPKGEAAQQSLALTVDVAPPVMSEIIRAVTVNMKSRRRTVSRAPCDETPEKVDHGGIKVKVLSTPKFCVASVRKRRVYGEMPAVCAIPQAVPRHRALLVASAKA